MADKNDRKQLKFILPRAPAIYPKLVKPDTKYDKDGKYECKQAFDADVIEPTIEKLVALRDEFAEELKQQFIAKKKPQLAKTLKLRDVGTPEFDENGDETGRIILKAASKASGKRGDGSSWERKIPLFDAKGKKITPKAIFGGSELKVAVIAEAYHKADGNEVGITLRIDAVQVLKLVQAGGGTADGFGFGVEDGYESDDDDSGSQFNDDSASEGGEKKSDGDVDF